MATKPNKNIKVSQATIDKIKKQGMTASLKSASSNNSPEYREALRRMYGDARLTKATASEKKPSTKYSPRPMGESGKASTSYSPRPMSETKKASTSYSPVKKAAPAKKPALGGFSMAAKALGNVGSRVERTPAKQKELEALQAKLRARRQAKKNK